MPATTFSSFPLATILERSGLIAIVRLRTSSPVAEAVRALHAGGISAVEITLNTPGALTHLRAVAADKPPGLCLGAGTILEVDDARQAHASGAEFIVTPTLQPDTIRFCREAGLPIFCGCATPTEMLAAHRAGADFIKLFPAVGMPTAVVGALLGPMPFLKIFPTGGVTIDSLPAWLAAGCTGAAIGTALVNDDRVGRGAWAEIEADARAFRTVIDGARGRRT